MGCCQSSFNDKNFQPDTVQVVDGDTFDCTAKRAKIRYRVRLLGVDTPEIRPRLSIPNHDIHKAAGIAAKKFVEAFVASGKRQTVVLVGRTDVFGRQLGNLLVDGKSLSGTLLKHKIGVPITNARHDWTLEELEASLNAASASNRDVDACSSK